MSCERIPLCVPPRYFPNLTCSRVPRSTCRRVDGASGGGGAGCPLRGRSCGGSSDDSSGPGDGNRCFSLQLNLSSGASGGCTARFEATQPEGVDLQVETRCDSVGNPAAHLHFLQSRSRLDALVHILASRRHLHSSAWRRLVVGLVFRPQWHRERGCCFFWAAPGVRWESFGRGGPRVFVARGLQVRGGFAAWSAALTPHCWRHI